MDFILSARIFIPVSPRLLLDKSRNFKFFKNSINLTTCWISASSNLESVIDKFVKLGQCRIMDKDIFPREYSFEKDDKFLFDWL